MELKPGYKQTDAGVIPEEWGVRPMSDLVVEFRGGAALKPSDFTRTGVKILPKGGVGRTGWLRIEDIDLQYCAASYAAAHRNNQVDQSYTIVVLRDLVPSGPSIGLMVQIKDAEAYVLAQGVYGFKLNEKADSRYLIQLSNTRWYRQLMNSIMVGSTQVHITNSGFRQARVPIPPLPEQRAIAAALSDVDALLTKLDQLLSKKHDLKQAAMQRLLTGRTRLPGFSGEWITRRVADFSAFVTKGATPTTYGFKWQENGVVFLRSECVAANGLDLGQSMFISQEAHSVLIRGEVRSGDILITITGNVGRVVLLADEFDFANINQHIARIRVRDPEVSAGFVFHWLSQRGIREHFLSITTGQAYPQISLKQVRETIIPIPSLQEQAAIATALSDMDAELVALESRRDKTRALKQGMMQELLTGRIRLV